MKFCKIPLIAGFMILNTLTMSCYKFQYSLLQYSLQSLLSDGFHPFDGEKNWKHAFDNSMANNTWNHHESKEFATELLTLMKGCPSLLNMGARKWAINKNKNHDIEKLNSHGFGDDIQANQENVDTYWSNSSTNSVIGNEYAGYVQNYDGPLEGVTAWVNRQYDEFFANDPDYKF